MNHMKSPHTNTQNFWTDLQLTQFIDASLSGLPFEDACAHAGIVLSSEQARRELKAYRELSHDFEQLTPRIVVPESLVEKIIAQASATPPTHESVVSPFIVLRQGWLQSPLRYSSWLLATPIAVVLFAVVVATGMSTEKNTEKNLAQQEFSSLADTAPAPIALSAPSPSAKLMSMSAPQDAGARARSQAPAGDIDTVVSLLSNEAEYDMQFSESVLDQMSLFSLDPDSAAALQQSYDETLL